MSELKVKLKQVKEEWNLQSVKRAANFISGKLNSVTQGNYGDIVVNDTNLIKREHIENTKEKSKSSLLNLLPE